MNLNHISSHVKKEIERFRSTFKGAERMHVVLENSFDSDNPAVAYANKETGSVHIYLDNVEMDMDLFEILIHEDLGHLLTPNVLNTQKSFAKLYRLILDSQIFNNERKEIEKYYSSNTQSLAKKASELDIDPVKYTDFIYSCEFISIWFQNNYNLKATNHYKDKLKRLFNNRIYRDPIIYLSQYLYLYQNETIIRPSNWNSPGITENKH